MGSPGQSHDGTGGNAPVREETSDGHLYEVSEVTYTETSQTVIVQESHREESGPVTVTGGSKVEALEPMALMEEDRAEIRRIASQLSLSRSITPAGVEQGTETGEVGEEKEEDGNGGIGPGGEGGDAKGYDPATDPDRPEFELNAWLRHFISQVRELGFTENQTGVAFRALDVFGSGSAVQVQQTAGSLLMAPFRLGELFSAGKKEPKHILRGFHGLVRSGELLAVLGRPGAGCSTLLRSLCGQLAGLKLGEGSVVHYGGISQEQMRKEFKGEAVYNQENDVHFPHLTVGQTLEFAAAVRTPAHRVQNMSRGEYSRYIARVVMTIFGLRHTYNTKVGNEFVRGISGGERKRVSISEMVLAGAPFGAWDNSTRGLDSAAALNFIEALRRSCDLGSHANAVAIYQASQSMYDLFDKATVLYEGRQIYFGPASRARPFFEQQGWLCPPRQSTGDFLTAITNPGERRARPGFEARVPRTADDFERYWRASPEFAALAAELDAHDAETCGGGGGGGGGGALQEAPPQLALLRGQKNFRQAARVRRRSPYTVGLWLQTRLNCRRAAQRIWNDITATMAATMMQAIFAIILGSSFVHTPFTTDGFFSRGSVLFVSVMLNALVAIMEITALYDQRPIIEKHASYAFYHPFTEAAAGVVFDIPLKFVTGTCYNVVLYFMTGMHREPGAFFLFFLVTYVAGFAMTAVFRTLAAVTTTVSQAMALSGVMVLLLIVYSGYIIPGPEMHPWFGWIRWINPIYYAFEILVANEFHGREFPCAPHSIVPAYQPPVGDSWICSVTGAVAGRALVSGDAFIEKNYSYFWSHVWRNFGILLAFLVAFMAIYFAAVELNSSTSTRAETLVFRRGKVPRHLLRQQGEHAQPAMTEGEPVPSSSSSSSSSSSPPAAAAAAQSSALDAQDLRPQTDIFMWKDVTLDISLKDEKRRLLDHVDGWVKPGTLTALMGVSGAGKTTLLNVLALRSNIGVVSGDMLVNGRPLDASFQRKTGYVQQQDIHVDTATVRESLQFSAELRQPSTVSKEEKYAFVEEVIKMLNMEEFADAVVGFPGEGLNLEQRKLLTIGVELAARPKLLLFLDEPTSGLDSQSSWAICAFLRKLADAGQAILCTVHQPSAILFQQFDRLLLLANGGKTVYFGDMGDNSQTMLGYFEGNGARKCGESENPAEYMIEVVNEGLRDSGKKDGGSGGNGGNGGSGRDWPAIWRASPEFRATREELDRLCSGGMKRSATTIGETKGPQEREKQQMTIDSSSSSSSRGTPLGPAEREEASPEFAMPLSTQIRVVTHRLLRHYWRSPSYLTAKFSLGIAAGLFIGFTFYHAGTSLAGMQNIIFSVYMVASIFSTIVQAIHPVFLAQRDLYETREQPSRAYSWVAFMVANIVVEIPYQVLTAVVMYACVYFPMVGASQSPLRQGFVLLLLVQLFLYASAFALFSVVVMPDAQTAASIVALLTIMSLVFNGVLQTPDALPVFWRNFMYRISPFTYWISAFVSTALHGRPVVCSPREISVFDPPANTTCGEYLAAHLRIAPGNLQNPADLSACRYCAFTIADQSLAASHIVWSEKWRNFGILWLYIAFDLIAAILMYYVFRVRKWKK